MPLGSEGDPNIDICVKLIRNELPPPVTQHRRVASKHLKTLMKVAADSTQIAKIYPSIYHMDNLIAPPRSFRKSD